MNASEAARRAAMRLDGHRVAISGGRGRLHGLVIGPVAPQALWIEDDSPARVVLWVAAGPIEPRQVFDLDLRHPGGIALITVGLAHITAISTEG